MNEDYDPTTKDYIEPYEEFDQEGEIDLKHILIVVIFSMFMCGAVYCLVPAVVF